MNARHVPAVLAWAAITGCTSQQTASPARSELGVLTVAVAGDQVFVGRARSFGSDGTFEMTSLSDSPIACRGRFRYSTPPTGRARFTCTNGDKGSLTLEAEGGYTGYGKGSSSLGPVRVVFGYSLRDVGRRLTMPAGKRLALDGDDIVLVDDEVD